MWLIPDDGIIDEVAIVVAATGQRPVALTRTERRLAFAVLLASGFPVGEIARRLAMDKSRALRLAREIWPRFDEFAGHPRRRERRRLAQTSSSVA